MAEPGDEFAAPIVVAATAISACVFAGRLAHVIAMVAILGTGRSRWWGYDNEGSSPDPRCTG